MNVRLTVLLVIAAILAGGFWLYARGDESRRQKEVVTSAKLERPCTIDLYYVSMNDTELCVPKKYLPHFALVDRWYGMRDPVKAFQNQKAVPVKELGIPLSDPYMKYDQFLEPLKGVQLSILPAQRDNFEFLLTQLAAKKYDSEIATVTYDDGRIIGHYRAFVETFYSKEYLRTSNPTTYYVRLEKDYKPGRKPYIITCPSKINDRKDWGGDQNAEFWQYSEGRLCHSTHIELNGGLVARLKFYDRRRPIESWHKLEAALDKFLSSLRVSRESR